MSNPYKRTKLACYTAYFTMASVFSLPPLLFVTLREQYQIPYTLLGTLVLVNFCTQLAVDLLFTAFGGRFSPKTIVKVMPLVTTVGLLTYAWVPTLFPQFAYGGLVLGTVIFSVAAGLSEVLLSPVIAAIPSDTPQRDMSMLHSLYAFGVLSVVVFSTLFLRVFGEQYWMILTTILACTPILAAVLFMTAPMPDLTAHSATDTPKTKGAGRGVRLALCVCCIFFGSCAENAMSNWISGYMERALHIPKTVGDMLGMAVFAVLLGLVRIGYAKFGKSILPVLLVGMMGAVACYLTAGLSDGVVVPFVACILTGVFTSMLWPGTLIMMEETVPGVGVAAFALMAAGGDLGASVAPQLMGIVVDAVSAAPATAELAQQFALTPEQIGMKAGMLVSALFPLAGTVVVLLIMRTVKGSKQSV